MTTGVAASLMLLVSTGWIPDGLTAPLAILGTAVAAILAAGGGIMLRRGLVGRIGRPGQFPPASARLQPVSLVLLLRTPRGLNGSRLRELAGQAYGTRFSTDPRSPNCVLPFRDSVFPMRVTGRELGVTNSARAYVNDPLAAAEGIDDARLRCAVRAHRAWMAVDWFGELPAGGRAEAYRLIGPLLAALAGPDCAAVCCPERQALVAYDSHIGQQLRGSNPLQIFVPDPVVYVSSDHPRLREAVEEARRRWPEFVDAFETGSGHLFAAKAPFHDGSRTEFMWVKVTAVENEIVYGILDNDPGIVSHIKPGQQVRFAVSELNDWIFRRGRHGYGGFTVAVLRDAQHPSGKIHDPDD